MKKIVVTLLVALALQVVLIVGCSQQPTAAPAKSAPPASEPVAQKAPKSESKTAPKSAPATVTAPTPPAKTSAEQPVPKQLVDVKMGVVATGVARYQTEFLKAKKLDEKYGVNIIPSYMDFAAGGNALKLGSIDVSNILQPSTAALFKSQGTDVAIFGPFTYSGNQFVVRKDAPGSSLKDFKGKKVGSFAKTTGAYFFAATLAALDGLSFDKDFQLTFAEAPALNGLLQRGDLDMIVQFDPYTTLLLATGEYRVLTEFDDVFEKQLGSKAVKTGVGAKMEWIQRNPKVALTIRNAVTEANEMIKRGEDRSFFETRGAELFGLNTKELVDTAYPRVQSNLQTKWDQATWDAQEKILENGKKLGLLPNDAPTDVFYKDLK